jgi:hypothetical protein
MIQMTKDQLERIKTLLKLGNDKRLESLYSFHMEDGMLNVTVAPLTSDRTIETEMDRLKTE